MKKIKILKLKKIFITSIVTFISAVSLSNLNFSRTYATSSEVCDNCFCYEDIQLKGDYNDRYDILKQVCCNQGFYSLKDQHIDKQEFMDCYKEIKNNKNNKNDKNDKSDNSDFFFFRDKNEAIKPIKNQFGLIEVNKVSVIKKSNYDNGNYSFNLQIEEFEPTSNFKNTEEKIGTFHNIKYDRPKKGDLITHINNVKVSDVSDFDLEGLVQELQCSQLLKLDFLRPLKNGGFESFKYSSNPDYTKTNIIPVTHTLQNLFGIKDDNKLNLKNNAHLLNFNINILNFDAATIVRDLLEAYIKDKKYNKKIAGVLINLSNCKSGNFYAARKLARCFLPKDTPYLHIKNLYDDNDCALNNMENPAITDKKIPIYIVASKDTGEAAKLTTLILKQHANTLIFSETPLYVNQIELKFFHPYNTPENKLDENFIIGFPKVAFKTEDEPDFSKLGTKIIPNFECRNEGKGSALLYIIKDMQHIFKNAGDIRSDEEKQKMFEEFNQEKKVITNLQKHNAEGLRALYNKSNRKKRNIVAENGYLLQAKKEALKNSKNLTNNSEDLLTLKNDDYNLSEAAYLFSIIVGKIAANNPEKLSLISSDGKQIRLDKLFNADDLKHMKTIYNNLNIKQCMQEYQNNNKNKDNSSNIINWNDKTEFIFSPINHDYNTMKSMIDSNNSLKRMPSTDDVTLLTPTNRSIVDKNMDKTLQNIHTHMSQSKRSALSSLWMDI